MPLFFSIGVVGLLAVFGFSPLLLLLGVFIGSAIPGCDPFKGDEYYIVADSFNDSRIDPIKRQLKAMIPESAQMIRAEIREGGFFGGGRARVRCRVDPKAMLAFIKAEQRKNIIRLWDKEGREHILDFLAPTLDGRCIECGRIHFGGMCAFGVGR